jgi:uncharacterized protein YkwD
MHLGTATGGPLGRAARALGLLLAAWALALAIAPAAPAARACTSTNATPAQAAGDELARSTLCLLNAERDRRGLRDLRLNDRLSAAAQAHAGDMQRHNYFSHDSRDGSSFVQRIRRAGYLRRASSWIVGENLAWGAGRHRSTPRGIVAAWMDSPPHRANILSPRFREIGVGVAVGAPRRVPGLPAGTYATTFGARG